jgi:hypothetical protein
MPASARKMPAFASAPRFDATVRWLLLARAAKRFIAKV